LQRFQVTASKVDRFCVIYTTNEEELSGLLNGNLVGGELRYGY
jgi:hypothetical protein